MRRWPLILIGMILVITLAACAESSTPTVLPADPEDSLPSENPILEQEVETYVPADPEIEANRSEETKMEASDFGETELAGTESQDEPDSILYEVARDYLFWTGAGARYSLTVNEDGTFSGSIQHPLEETPTNFSGQFSAPEAINAYTYTMTVEQIQGDNPDFSEGAEVLLYVGGGALIQDMPRAVYNRMVLSLVDDTISPLVLPYWTIYSQTSDHAYMADGLTDGENQTLTIAGNLSQIPENAFRGCRLQAVIIPETVTHIGDYAFAYCSELTDVTIQGSASIGYEAFEGCSQLRNVNVDERVTEIGGFAFRYTPWLEEQGEFAVLNGVLLNYAGNSSEIVLPDQISKIGAQAFVSAQINQSLTITKLTIPISVSSIEAGAFAGYSGMTICGVPGSYAEVYAKENNIPFLPDVAGT